MDEDLRIKLKNAVDSAFDVWAAQHYDYLITSSTPETIDKLVSDASLEDLFLIKRADDIGFYLYVLKKVNSNKKLQRQKKVLLKACIKSITTPAGVVVEELRSKTAEDEAYTRRHTQRLLRDKYASALFESEKRPKNETFSPYMTVFSPYEEPKTKFEGLIDYFKNQTELLSEQKDIVDRIKHKGILRNVMPEYLSDFLQFRHEAVNLMKEIRDESEYSRIFFLELKTASDISMTFHHHFHSIMAVSWWRSRRSETQKRLLNEKYTFRYTNHDAETARELLNRFTGSEELTEVNLRNAALELYNIGMLQSTLSLFKQCLKTSSYSDKEKGIMHEEIAVILREQNKPKLMVQEMKKALEIHNKNKDTYRVCVALKNLGEAEWKLGYKNTAQKYFDEAESLTAGLDQKERAHVLGNLAVSAMRLGERKLEIDYLIKFLNELPDEQTDVILRVDRRLSELMR